MASLKVHFISLIFILVALPGVAWADTYPGDSLHDKFGNSGECTARDLRSYLGPNRDQGDIGWCYANAAADILDFRFRNSLPMKEGHPVRVSAIFVALNYTQKNSTSLVSNSGLVNLALTESMENGFCDQSLENNAVKNGMRIGLKEKLDVLQNIKTLYDLGLQTGDFSKYEALMTQLREVRSIVTAVSNEDLNNTLKQSTAKNFIMNFVLLICNDSVKYRPPVLKPVFTVPKKTYYFPLTHVVSWVERHDLLKDLDEQLSQNNIVGINYKISLLSDYKFTSPDHASVVIGRRFNFTKNRCEHLIRNSWGGECLTFDSKKKQKVSRYLPNLQCDDGNIWVSDDDFRESLSAITYLPQ